ncbi:MAG: pyruvate dehydrogenase (acetyl-transferring) E1 component subunit alpha, partial [Rhodobacterales bacterium]|nr:pyruvate dehydrogenase (acetyl-transferring) E1 component subunit alpha [Rhodobacterales bacterium]
GEDTVTFTYFGDGAANQGQVYESFNMAALWKLPVIFVVENNRYAMGTSLQRAASTPDFYTRGEAFGIAGAVVDGMDVLAVKAAGELAVEHCRAGNGPFVLEVKTYRYRGHSMSDPARYRSKEEVKNVKDNQDPIDVVKEMLIQGGHSTQDDLKIIDKDIKKIVQESADFAIASPEPDLNELYTDILV